MHSLTHLLFYISLCVSFLHLSSAAPAAACVVSYYFTTILVPATSDPAPDPILSTTADNVVATTSASPVLSSTTSTDPPVTTPDPPVSSSTTSTDPPVTTPDPPVSSSTTSADPPVTTPGPPVSSSTTSTDPPVTTPDPPILTSTTSADPSVTTSDPPVLSSITTTDPPVTTSTSPATPTSTVPTLPVNGGPAELPSPTAALKFVTVGRGVQNYSCFAAGAIPVQVGALATLYDFTSLAETSESTLNMVPSDIVYTPISSASGSTLTVDSIGTFPIIGHHYFAADGTPTFDLSYVGDLLSCTKIATVSAPPNADVGPDGTGAVPWLMLTDKGGSVGLSQVYRVETAGGKAPAICTDTNLISIQYAAEYWFFG